VGETSPFETAFCCVVRLLSGKGPFALAGAVGQGEETTFVRIYFLGEIWSSKSAIVCRVFGFRSPSLVLRSIASANAKAP